MQGWCQELTFCWAFLTFVLGFECLNGIQADAQVQCEHQLLSPLAFMRFVVTLSVWLLGKISLAGVSHPGKEGPDGHRSTPEASPQDHSQAVHQQL